MLTKIEHFPIPLQTVFTMQMPADAKILAIVNLGEVPTLCVQLYGPDYEHGIIEKQFELHASGEEFETNHLPGYIEYIGTFSLNGGARVFHLFEIKT